MMATVRHHHRVLDANAAEAFQVNAGFDGDRHAGLEARLVALAETRGFVDLQAEAVAGGVYEGAGRAVTSLRRPDGTTTLQACDRIN